MAFSPLSLISPSLAPTACGAKPNLGFFGCALATQNLRARNQEISGRVPPGSPRRRGNQMWLKGLASDNDTSLGGQPFVAHWKKADASENFRQHEKKIESPKSWRRMVQIFLLDCMIFGFHLDFPGCNTEQFTISGSFFQKNQPRKCLSATESFDWNSLEAEPVYIDMKHAKYLEFHFWAHGRSSPAPDHTNAPTVPMPLLDQKNISKTC